ncbi:Bin3-domain-containing protein [Ramaria rubella]|nr:Bin3-domain-containing protein [Ramaria rubella]
MTTTTLGGAQPIHGNYKGYYTKRPFVNDPRLALLPSDFFRNSVVLDIGCNEGWVTCEIAQQWGAKKVIGVDIDSELIRTAWRRRRTVWSLQEPDVHISEEPEEPEPLPPRKKRKRHHADHDVDTDNMDNAPPPRPRHSYFPQAMEHMFGSLPIPSSTSLPGQHNPKFPHNVSFHTADWVSNGLPSDAQLYDAVLAFSISKWIHLNNGDEGLLRFFRRVASVLQTGGRFILEPQAWDTYAKAKRMDARLKETAASLKIRPEDFPGLLSELGFGERERLGTIGEGGFRRPVDVYIKR